MNRASLSSATTMVRLLEGGTPYVLSATAGLIVAYAYRCFQPTVTAENAATPKHWSNAEPDLTGRLLRAAASAMIAYSTLEGHALIARGLTSEPAQTAAALQGSLIIVNMYALFESSAALKLRRRYYDLDKDPPPGWPPVKCAVMWRVLAADSIALSALALVEAFHGCWRSATLRVTLSAVMYGLVVSNPLPFYTA